MDRRYFIDCEFDGHGGPLLSMAVVPEDGRGLYLCVADPPRELEPWVAANVWPLVHMRLPVGKTVAFLEDWGHFIGNFIGRDTCPTVIADSPVDIGRFCSVISTGSDGGWASAEFPRMTFEVHNVDCYPTDLPGAIQHNAWWDAMALRHKLCDSGSGPEGENSRSEVEAESPQSGGAAASPMTASDALTLAYRIPTPLFSRCRSRPAEISSGAAIPVNLLHDEPIDEEGQRNRV